MGPKATAKPSPSAPSLLRCCPGDIRHDSLTSAVDARMPRALRSLFILSESKDLILPVQNLNGIASRK